MIKFISIKHFRTHAESRFKLSSGLNVIAGRTRSGKSNIIRAIVLNLFNRPSGVRVVSDLTPFKERTAEVELGFSERKSIKIFRKIRKGRLKDNFSVDTEYQILTGRGKVLKEFSKMKFSVPDLVQDLANISEINIQSQLSPHFLVTSSGGLITKEINKLTDFEKIDNLLSHLTTKINEGRRWIIRKGKDKRELEEKLRALKGLGDIEHDISRLKILEKTHVDTKAKAESLRLDLLSRQKLIKKVDFLSDIDFLSEKMKKIDQLSEKIELIDTKKTAIIAYLKKVDAFEKIKNEHEETLTEYLDLLTELKKCPICLSDIGKKELERIRYEHI